MITHPWRTNNCGQLEQWQREANLQYREWVMAELRVELCRAAHEHFSFVAKVNREYDRQFAMGGLQR